MFHFIVAEGSKTWQLNPTEFLRDRIINRYKYTAKSLADYYGGFDGKNGQAQGKEIVEELKTFPMLLADEGKEGYFRIAALKEMNTYRVRVELSYHVLDEIPPLPMAALVEHKAAFGVQQNFEFERIHWALREGNLFSLLVECQLLSHEQARAAEQVFNTLIKPEVDEANDTDTPAPEDCPDKNQQVLLLTDCENTPLKTHCEQELCDWLETQKLSPWPLHQRQHSREKTLEALLSGELQCDFALLLLTNQSDSNHLTAQREVLFTLGYCTAAMGRGRVVVLFEAGVEPLFDLPSWFYFLLKDDAGLWRETLTDITAGID